MQLSPMGQQAAVRAEQYAAQPPDPEDPEKIRVVVRKRPINRKVGAWGWVVVEQGLPACLFASLPRKGGQPPAASSPRHCQHARNRDRRSARRGRTTSWT